MKNLRETIELTNEIKKSGIWVQHRDETFSVCISEKNFNKISKNKTVSSPYPNERIKIIDNNNNIKYNVMPNGATAIITQMNDDEKSWYLRGGDAQKYKNQVVFIIKLYSANKEIVLAKDTIYFPIFELLNHFGYKSKYGIPENSIGVLDVSANLGSYAHAFSAKAIDKIKQVIEFVGFKIIEK